MRLTVKAKLAGAFGIVIILSMIAGGVGYMKLSDMVATAENLVARAKMFFRRAMTVEAPLHLKRPLLIHEWHLVDRPVAIVASDAFGDVNAVIEINKVRKLIDTRPLD